MFSCFRAFVFSLILLSAALDFAHSGNEWKQAADGILYKKILMEQFVADKAVPAGKIHLFQIDTLKYRLDTITAKQLGMTNIDAKSMAQKTGAIIAVNGGFFTPEYAPLGLLVQNGREINKLKWTGWWHIFQMRRFKPQIITKKEYALTPEIEMAIEAGPRLLTDGRIQEGLKAGIAERTAIGISQDGKIILAVTEGYAVSLADFARILLENSCYAALNLDGGSSTQLYAKFRGFELNRNGPGPVANGIGVFSR